MAERHHSIEVATLDEALEVEVEDEKQPEQTVLAGAAADAAPLPPYSVYNGREKWFLVAMVAVAGFFSPLPANIYFPAIPQMAVAFHESTSALNQTVTAYLILQGLSPMLWGSLSDRYGRRPVLMGCMVVLCGSCIGLALCPASAFWLLVLLRCVQSAGCASTIALGAGVVGDISTPRERGGFFGMFNIGPMIAPCIGPAIGGVIAERLGWRAIFWTLVIMSALCLVFLLLFLPETLRRLVGNGTIQLGGIYRPLIPVVGRRLRTPDAPTRPLSTTVSTPMNPFLILSYPDVLVSLFFTGVVYAVNYTITATISSSFEKVYPWLTEIEIGLCYLPTGAGMIAGSTVTGKLLDREHARMRRIVAEEEERTGLPVPFPKEVARLRWMPAHLAVFSACVFAWGFCMQYKASLAVPLVIQVILGYTSMAILNTTMTLLIDILQTRSSAATACTNLVRCLMAAILVACIDKITSSRMGEQFTYVMFGCICLGLLPLMYVEMRIGSRWRMARDKRDELEESS